MVTVSIKTQAYVDQKRRIMIDLPDEVQPGMVELDMVVRQISHPVEDYETGSLEWTRAKLIAAGLVNPNAQYAPPDAEEMSEEEELALGRKMAGSRPVEDYINEDREERF